MCGWTPIFFRYPNLECSVLRHPGSESARCRGSRCITAPSCCRRAGCSCDYGLCDGPSARAVFSRKTPGRILRRPTGRSSALDFGTLLFSFSFLSPQSQIVDKHNKKGVKSPIDSCSILKKTIQSKNLKVPS